MATAKLTEEQRVQKAHVWLMKNPKYCLYSGIFMVGETRVVDSEQECPTAYTNGRDTRYGRKFVAPLSDAELRGLILHENLHKAFRHLTLWKHLFKIDAKCAGIACDFVINLMIHDSDPQSVDVALPKGGCFDEKYRGMDAMQVFNDLRKNQKQKPGQGKPCQQGQGGAGEKKPGQGGKNNEGDEFDEHDWEAAEQLTTEEKEQLARDVDQALRQGMLLAGKMKGNQPREIADVLKSKVDWKEALRDFVTSVCADRDESTWRRPARRWIGQDIYMPSLIGETVGRGVIAIDMSGSIGPCEIGQMLGECMKIFESVKPAGIDLLYWDTDVNQHEKYEQDQLDTLMQSTKPRGGGGTSPSCITQYIKEKKLTPEFVIILTDGYVGGDWGSTWPCPVLWGITSEGITAGNGKTIYLPRVEE